MMTYIPCDHSTTTTQTMAALKGTRWSDEELGCLVKIWAEDGFQQQLDKLHKNSQVFSQIRDRLAMHGYRRSIDQCRDKLKKLKIQYLKIRDALQTSPASASEEREKFRWYDALDEIIGHKSRSQQCFVEPTSPSDGPSTDDSSGTPLIVKKEESDDDQWADPNTSDATPSTSETSTRAVSPCIPAEAPSPASRKRKRKRTDTGDIMEAFLEMQRKQHDEMMQAEQARHQLEMKMFSDWMKAQRELEERQQQHTDMMFQQLLTSLQKPAHKTQREVVSQVKIEDT